MNMTDIRQTAKSIDSRITDSELDLGISNYEATGGATIYHPLHFIAAACENREVAEILRAHALCEDM